MRGSLPEGSCEERPEPGTMGGLVQVRVWLLDPAKVDAAERTSETTLPIDPRSIPLEHFRGTYWNGMDNIPVSYDYGERIVLIGGQEYEVRVDYGPKVSSDDRVTASQMVSSITVATVSPSAG